MDIQEKCYIFVNNYKFKIQYLFWQIMINILKLFLEMYNNIKIVNIKQLKEQEMLNKAI